jgi:hypothetical protein
LILDENKMIQYLNLRCIWNNDKFSIKKWEGNHVW